MEVDGLRPGPAAPGDVEVGAGFAAGEVSRLRRGDVGRLRRGTWTRLRRGLVNRLRRGAGCAGISWTRLRRR